MFGPILLFIFLVVFTGLSLWIPIQFRWVIMLILFGGFLIVIGQRVTAQKDKDGKQIKTGRSIGILIDNRFKMSLSRFQITLWTVLIFSAITVMGFDRAVPVLQGRISAITNPAGANQKAEPYGTLNIKFPQEVLVALGISTTSLAAASLIKSNKTETKSNKIVTLLADQKRRAEEKIKEADDLDQAIKALTDELNEKKKITPNDENYNAALLRIDKIEKEELPAVKKKWETAQAKKDSAEKELEQVSKNQEEAKGDIHTNDSVHQAEWSDMFRGELVSNYTIIDIAKVQMFYFTILLIFTYGTLIWGLLLQEPAWQTAAMVELPPFSDSLVGLLGISHAGYLAVKQTGS